MIRDVVAELIDRGHVAVGGDALGFEIRNGKLQMHGRALDLPGRMGLAPRMRDGRNREARPQGQNQDQEGVNETYEARHGLPDSAGFAASALFSAWFFS